MSEGITISIDDKELQQAISKIKSWETKKIRQVGNAVAETVVNINQRAKKLAPVNKSPFFTGRGRLRASIDMKMMNNRLSGKVFTDVHYAPHVELGTRAHIIRPHGKYLVFPTGDGIVFAREVHHPGTAKQPFMRPAAMQERRSYINKVTQALQ